MQQLQEFSEPKNSISAFLQTLMRKDLTNEDPFKVFRQFMKKVEQHNKSLKKDLTETLMSLKHSQSDDASTGSLQESAEEAERNAQLQQKKKIYETFPTLLEPDLRGWLDQLLWASTVSRYTGNKEPGVVGIVRLHLLIKESLLRTKIDDTLKQYVNLPVDKRDSFDVSDLTFQMNQFNVAYLSICQIIKEEYNIEIPTVDEVESKESPSPAIKTPPTFLKSQTGKVDKVLSKRMAAASSPG